MLQIASYNKLSTVDWPGKLVSTAFLQGCPWNCYFCFNISLIDPRVPGKVSPEDILEHLSKRRGILSGIVFSGGDPLRQSYNLVPFIKEIKHMGFDVGIHTEGAYPQGLVRVLPYIDWVGLDIKALPEDYDKVTQTINSYKNAELSLDLLISSPVDFEVRTTIYKGSPQGDNIFQIGDFLKSRGVYDRWHIQIARGEYPAWDLPLPKVDIRA